MIKSHFVRGSAAAIAQKPPVNAHGLRRARSQNSSVGLLDLKLAPSVRILILLAVGLLPTCYVLKHYHPQTQFTSLILFGAEFQGSALAEIKAMKPAVDSPFGYDGQFYAQLAVDPLLKNPQLQKALDNPVYRAERILLPLVAYLAGLGQPSLIVQIYALLNLFFWFLLLLGLVHYLHASTSRDYLCILATVFTTGALISVQRALTDLPAATLGFYASALSGAAASLVMSMAILTRETSLLFLLKLAWPPPNDRREVLALAYRAVYVTAPLALWLIYVHHSFGWGLENTGNLGLPFRGWALHVYSNWKMLSITPFNWHFNTVASWLLHLFEFLAPLSLMLQACSFAVWRSPRCAYWRMGVGFAVMFVFLTLNVFAEQIAFCRVVLPMTIAFNIGLMEQKGSVFAFNFIAGNLGLLWAFMDTLRYCILR
jgi:hypothetical protein